MAATRTTRSRMRFPASMLDLNRYQSTAHGHDFDGLSRVVMVRKTDQRTFASAKNGETPKFETVTRETIETFHGNRTERKVTSLEKRDVRKSPELLDGHHEPLIHTSNSKTSTPKKIVNDGSRLRKQPTPTPEEFAEECLKAHNEYRAKHGVDPLKLSKKICKVSQAWADSLALKGILTESKNTEYGENIFCSWSSKPTYQPNGHEPVDSWYEEHKKHEFGVEPKNLKSGHFTQIVWKDTMELGIAYAKAKNGKVYVVANYYPPGNFVGNFAQNVPPMGGFAKVNGTAVSEIVTCKTSTPINSSKTRIASTGGEGDFEAECLLAHNEYRKLHGVGPLKLNKKMCKYSEEWAKVLATKGQMEHRKNSEYGENIFCSWSSNASHTVNGREPVENWYNEIKCHNFLREPSNLKSGHFTQVIWRDSEELGVAIAKNRNGQIFVVATYCPPGNFVGSFVENVPPIGGPPIKKKIAETVKLITDEDFSKESTRIHSEYRKKHNCPEIKYSKQLTAYAKEWATQLALEDKFYHRPDSKYGENIFYLWSSDPNVKISPRDVCKSWYDEIKDYSWPSEPRIMKAGHFTQMIWKSSTEMGMAYARGKNGKMFVVANYNPRGNCSGQFTANVPKPR